MSFLSASVLAKLRKGSYEERALSVQYAAEEKLGQTVNVISTTGDGMVLLAEDGSFYTVKYSWDSKGLSGEIDVEKADVPLVEDLDTHLAEELRAVTRALMRGDVTEETRNRFRDLGRRVESGGDYWLSGISAKISEACGDDGWFATYSEQREEIRGALKGQIRALEGRVPRTRYTKLGAEKMGKYEDDLRESVSVLRKILCETVDSCQDFVFSSEGDTDLEGFKDSLIEEARVVAGMLAKVERLVTKADLYEMAQVHDTIADRAKDVMIVAGYLGRSQPQPQE